MSKRDQTHIGENSMKLTSSYPVICTDNIQKSHDFYKDYFDFETTFEADWYVSLRSRQNPNYELALLNYHHPSVPEGFREPTRGMLLNFEVEDVDREYKKLKARDLPMALDIKSEEWGQRHFITPDPNGILIDVIQNIKPAGNFTEQYQA